MKTMDERTFRDVRPREHARGKTCQRSVLRKQAVWRRQRRRTTASHARCERTMESFARARCKLPPGRNQEACILQWQKATGTATASSAAGKKPNGPRRWYVCLFSFIFHRLLLVTFVHLVFVPQITHTSHLLHREDLPVPRGRDKIHGCVQRSGFERVLMRLDDAERKTPPIPSRGRECDRHRHRPE